MTGAPDEAERVSDAAGTGHVAGPRAAGEAPGPRGGPPDCATCGACCREAFDTVPVEEDDARTLAARPDWIAVAADGWREIRRVPSPLGCGTRCSALTGDGGPEAPYRCRIYADRPSACSGLEAGSEACRFARSRVGLEGR